MDQAAVIIRQGIRQWRIGIILPVLHQAVRAATKILLKPNVKARHLKATLLYRHAARVIDEFASGSFQQGFAGFSRVGGCLEMRRAESGVRQRVMRSAVLPNGTENTMLDIIQRNFFIFDGKQLRTPRTARCKTGRNIDVADGCHWVARHDEVDRESVIDTVSYTHLRAHETPEH